MKRKSTIVTSLILSLTLFLTSVPFSAAAEADQLHVIELTTEYQEEPLGIDVESPRFAWQMESNLIGAHQSAYRIKVTDQSGEQVWDSDVVEDDTSVAVQYQGGALQENTTYCWEVTVWNTDGKKATSSSTFTTGLKEDWGGAEWISSTVNPTNTTMFRTEQPFQEK